jgi:hypothetical protein
LVIDPRAAILAGGAARRRAGGAQGATVVETARWLKQQQMRRFPPPWSAEESEACYIVRDANGQALAYVYYEQEPGRRAAAKLLTHDEARRIAANIAKLPWAKIDGAPNGS